MTSRDSEEFCPAQSSKKVAHRPPQKRRTSPSESAAQIHQRDAAVFLVVATVKAFSLRFLVRRARLEALSSPCYGGPYKCRKSLLAIKARAARFPRDARQNVHKRLHQEEQPPRSAKRCSCATRIGQSFSRKPFTLIQPVDIIRLR